MGTAFVQTPRPIDSGLVRRAMAILQQRHPFFRAYLHEERNANRMFLKIDGTETLEKQEQKLELEWIDWTNETEPITRQTVVDKSAQFDSIPFVYGKDHLLWKCQVIAYKDVATSAVKYIINLVIHIAITDGINTTTLTIELINILNALLTDQQCDEMRIKLGNSSLFSQPN